MTESTATPAVAPLGLLSRIVGVIVSPKATFANVVAAPRPAGILLVAALVIGAATAAPQFTPAGRQAVTDAQIKAAERSGRPITPEATAAMEGFNRYLPYITFVGSLIALPIMALILTAIYWAAFNTILGGTASFKQALATVTHAQVIAALGALVAVPIMLMRPTATPGGPFNLGALVPMLEQGSKLAGVLSKISVFSIWGVFVTSVGLAVLYHRKTTGIFVALLVVSVLIAYGLTALFG